MAALADSRGSSGYRALTDKTFVNNKAGLEAALQGARATTQPTTLHPPPPPAPSPPQSSLVAPPNLLVLGHGRRSYSPRLSAWGRRVLGMCHPNPSRPRRVSCLRMISRHVSLDSSSACKIQTTSLTIFRK